MKQDLTENELFVKGLPCEVCGKRPVDVHHIKTRGSGGDNSLSNLSSLCRLHHSMFHNMGRKTFFQRFGKQMMTRRLINGMPPFKLEYMDASK